MPVQQSGAAVQNLPVPHTLRRAVLLCLFAAAGCIYGQEGALPVELLRPQYGEAPRFPRDYWIGGLGRGDAGEEAYRAAKRFLEQLVHGNAEELPDHIAAAGERLKNIGIRAVRIGGGRKEPDGAVSFLVRFLGREEAVAGELYLKQAGKTEDGEETRFPPENWIPDDLILEKSRPLGEGQYGPGRADMNPYERFF